GGWGRGGGGPGWGGRLPRPAGPGPGGRRGGGFALSAGEGPGGPLRWCDPGTTLSFLGAGCGLVPYPVGRADARASSVLRPAWPLVRLRLARTARPAARPAPDHVFPTPRIRRRIRPGNGERRARVTTDNLPDGQRKKHA